MLDSILKFVGSEKFYLPIIYILVGMVVNGLCVRAINGVGKFDIKKSRGLDKRKNTIIVLVRNIVKYIIAIIVIIMILGVYGVNTTSLIASLGVVTAIIGLAFQDTIKDFLAGVFLIFDNAYAVGDTVKINGFTGEVISLGLKNTKIRAYTGEVMTLSNSSFTEVINYNLSNSKVMVYVPVHYEVDVIKLEKILNKIKVIIEDDVNVYGMDLLGIDEFSDSCIKYAIVIECASMTHFGVKRKVLGLIKKMFDDNNIVIPYNQIDVHIEK